MKKIKVIVKDKNTLILDEAGNKGDYIDLADLSNVDFSSILASIDNACDKVYNQKLNEFKSKIDAENNARIISLETKYKEKIIELNNKLEGYEAIKKRDIELVKTQIKEDSLNKINELNNIISNYNLAKKNEIDIIKSQNELEKLQQARAHDLELKNIKDEYIKLLSEKDEIIKHKEDAFISLQRQRAALNVKQTGEDLESWCNNEVNSYMQNGLTNCTWIKDNKVVKEEGEAKGSKADYIFNVYARDTHLDDELLTSVCLDMKDENPDSQNKKKNSEYYKALDSNRNKKNCKYAVLVSNLESDKSNDLPIFKVLEYPDMYVVRPAYMMTFLNMIASLSKRFADLILADIESKLELKNSIDMMNEFEAIKKTYLDNPLEKLSKEISSIRKNNEAILIASKKIDDSCDTITKGYLNIIEEKLSKFDIKLDKELKKYNKKITINNE